MRDWGRNDQHYSTVVIGCDLQKQSRHVSQGFDGKHDGVLRLQVSSFVAAAVKPDVASASVFDATDVCHEVFRARHVQHRERCSRHSNFRHDTRPHNVCEQASCPIIYNYYRYNFAAFSKRVFALRIQPLSGSVSNQNSFCCCFERSQLAAGVDTHTPAASFFHGERLAP